MDRKRNRSFIIYCIELKWTWERKHFDYSVSPFVVSIGEIKVTKHNRIQNLYLYVTKVVTSLVSSEQEQWNENKQKWKQQIHKRRQYFWRLELKNEQTFGVEEFFRYRINGIKEATTDQISSLSPQASVHSSAVWWRHLEDRLQSADWKEASEIINI